MSDPVTPYDFGGSDEDSHYCSQTSAEKLRESGSTGRKPVNPLPLEVNLCFAMDREMAAALDRHLREECPPGATRAWLMRSLLAEHLGLPEPPVSPPGGARPGSKRSRWGKLWRSMQAMEEGS